MHCTIDDLATLHTFAAHFHDALHYVDTLDEDLASPDLLAVHTHTRHSMHTKPTGKMLLCLRCIAFVCFLLNNSADESRKWRIPKFLATGCTNDISMLLCLVESIQKVLVEATHIQLGNADPADSCNGESVHSIDDIWLDVHPSWTWQTAVMRRVFTPRMKLKQCQSFSLLIWLEVHFLWTRN